MNWTVRKRWGTTILVSLFMFISRVPSSMVAPAFGTISSDLNIQSPAETQLVLSVFVLGSAVGPLAISPMSEVYGRTVVLRLTCLFYMIFNLACGFSHTKGQLVVFRYAIRGFVLSWVNESQTTQISKWNWGKCSGSWRGLAGRLLESRGAGAVPKSILYSTIDWPSHWSYCWCIHYASPRIALDVLYNIVAECNRSDSRLGLAR